jgi:hypothetical protein
MGEFVVSVKFVCGLKVLSAGIAAVLLFLHLSSDTRWILFLNG